VITEDEYDERLSRARLDESKRNTRDNVAVAASTANLPKRWTEAEEAALVLKQYGSDSERIARLVREHNARNK
jgi:hypothetical protein